MSRARRVAATALCVALAVGIAGQLTGRLDLSRAIGLQQRTIRGSGAGGTDQAASSVPKVDGQTARLAAAQDLLSARAAAVKARSKSSWMATVDLPDRKSTRLNSSHMSIS